MVDDQADEERGSQFNILDDQEPVKLEVCRTYKAAGNLLKPVFLFLIPYGSTKSIPIDFQIFI